MVIITTGKICSGKSTWAYSMPNYLVLSIDEVILTLFDSCLKTEHQKTVLKIQEYFLNKIIELNKIGVTNIIIDDSFYEQKRRLDVINFLEKNNIEVKIKYFNLPDEIRIERLKERNEINKKSLKRQFILSIERMQEIDSKFEDFSLEEQKYLLK